MSGNASSLLSSFAGRPPALYRAWLRKDRRLSLTDTSEVGVDEKHHCATFVISTDDPDRVGDVVEAQGIDLTHFTKNPIAFYGHQVLPLPIGKWEDPRGNCTIALERHRAIGTCYFSQRSREAQQIFALVCEGILRATSIGFNPLVEPIPRSPREDNPQSLQAGYRFPKVDLLEVSVVGIPAQPTATLVREVISRGRLAGWPIVPAIRKSLKPLCEPAPVWSHGADLSGGDPVSKRLGKTTPKGEATKPDCPPCHCDDESKALDGTSGAAGGYTVPEDDPKKKAAAVAQRPPPKRGGQDQAPRDQPAADEQPQQQPSDQQPDDTGKADPKEVLNRLVDALAAYLDLTAAAKPAPEDEEEDEEEDDDDMPDQQQDQDSEVGDDRYEFRDTRPRHNKSKIHALGIIKRCKAVMGAAAQHCKDLYDLPENAKWTAIHKSACLLHHKELSQACKDMDGGGGAPAAAGDPEDTQSGDDGESNHPAAPVTKEHELLDFGPRPDAATEDLDFGVISRELAGVKQRVVAVGNAWDNLNGAMP